MSQVFDRRPIMIAIAGPNGAGKSTFYHAHLKPSGLRYVNADELALLLQLEAYRAAEQAGQIRQDLVESRQSFVFETVFSDPAGDKLAFLRDAEQRGYTVILIFIGVDSPITSNQRVSIRVSKGGHDVPAEKVFERYPRILENLRRALVELENVRVYDNSDLTYPYRLVAVREEGQLEVFQPVPRWLKSLLPKR